MAKIERIDRLVAKLRAKAAASIKGDSGSVVVGYTAKYAVFVHENVEAKNIGKNVPRRSGLGTYWNPGGPKFLEGPARSLRNMLATITFNAVKGGKTLMQGLLLAGLKLQAESQKVVPVEYGLLRASAFTRVDKGEA